MAAELSNLFPSHLKWKKRGLFVTKRRQPQDERQMKLVCDWIRKLEGEWALEMLCMP